MLHHSRQLAKMLFRSQPVALCRVPYSSMAMMVRRCAIIRRSRRRRRRSRRSRSRSREVLPNMASTPVQVVLGTPLSILRHPTSHVCSKSSESKSMRKRSSSKRPLDSNPNVCQNSNSSIKRATANLERQCTFAGRQKPDPAASAHRTTSVSSGSSSQKGCPSTAIMMELI